MPVEDELPPKMKMSDNERITFQECENLNSVRKFDN